MLAGERSTISLELQAAEAGGVGGNLCANCVPTQPHRSKLSATCLERRSPESRTSVGLSAQWHTQSN